MQAGSGSPKQLHHRNIRLDTFLKRNTERDVYERIRAYEPCVVISTTVNKVFMHVVISDEWLYLAEYPPRTLTAVLNFGCVRDIELVNDLPEFLDPKDRERCQHIRIVYTTERPTGKGRDWLRRRKGEGHMSIAPPSRRASYCPSETLPGYPADSQRQKDFQPVLKSTRSASCPNSASLGLHGVPHTLSPSPLSLPEENSPTQESGQEKQTIGSVLKRDDASREEELHLYAVSQVSRLYLHMQSVWSSYIIRSTLMLDPTYRKKFTSSDAPTKRISTERTLHLFGQLRSELLQEGISVEKLYLLLQELQTAAHRNVTLRRLFWKSNEVCVFLVQTLEKCLHSRQSHHAVYTADELLLSTLIVETLSIMFRETEVEASRIGLLSAENGALASRILLALICDPLQKTNSRRSSDGPEFKVLLADYLDAACSLLFEILLLGHETNRCVSTHNFLSVGWTLRVLQPHPHLKSFISHQARQVVRVLSSQQKTTLSPAQSVLLYQRCRLLLACLQHSKQLTHHLCFYFREDFRYLVKPSVAAEKLPDYYPISQPTLRLVRWILTLIDASLGPDAPMLG